MPKLPFAPTSIALAEHGGELRVRFLVGPRAVRRKFTDALHLEIERARTAGEIDPDISQELWRTLQRSELA